MLFVLVAYDGTDEGAPARRQAARPAHLEGVGCLSAAGNLKVGGALLDDDGKMIGSMMILDYPSEEALRAEFLATEPYVTEGVWQEIRIHPFRPPGEVKL